MSRTDWFTEAFGVAVGDIRDKLVFEGWFDRKTPEHRSNSDLGWTREEQARPEQSQETQSQDNSREPDRGIER